MPRTVESVSHEAGLSDDGVAVAGTGVAVGGAAVGEGGTSVGEGGIGVTVLGSAVALGGTLVAVGATGCAVAAGTSDGGCPLGAETFRLIAWLATAGATVGTTVALALRQATDQTSIKQPKIISEKRAIVNQPPSPRIAHISNGFASYRFGAVRSRDSF